MIRHAAALMSLSLLAVLPLQAAEMCPLIVNDVSGVDWDWSLVGGVPIPQGAIDGPEDIQILDGDGRPVEAQIDIATTYRDGSPRWALVSMMAPPDGEYVAQIGDVQEIQPEREAMLVQMDDGAYEVDTFPTSYTVTDESLVPQAVTLTPPGTIIGFEAYCIDNQGRRAVAAGPEANIEVSVLKSGPVRTVLRTEGDYVLDDGTPVARGICIMEFFADRTSVNLTHTFVLTQDTNELWFRDYGITAALPGESDAVATFDTDRAFDQTVRGVPLSEGDEAAITQVEFPHFGERESLYELMLFSDNRGEMLESGDACGEWADLTRGDTGCMIAVRDFAEQFPKGYSATQNALTVHLWPERSGKELDFRSETLIRDYWKSWAEQAPGGPEALKTGLRLEKIRFRLDHLRPGYGDPGLVGGLLDDIKNPPLLNKGALLET